MFCRGIYSSAALIRSSLHPIDLTLLGHAGSFRTLILRGAELHGLAVAKRVMRYALHVCQVRSAAAAAAAAALYVTSFLSLCV
jgi:hypothetical protein